MCSGHCCRPQKRFQNVKSLHKSNPKRLLLRGASIRKRSVIQNTNNNTFRYSVVLCCAPAPPRVSAFNEMCAPHGQAHGNAEDFLCTFATFSRIFREIYSHLSNYSVRSPCLEIQRFQDVCTSSANHNPNENVIECSPSVVRCASVHRLRHRELCMENVLAFLVGRAFFDAHDG